MMNDMTGKTQREREKEKTQQSIFLELVLSFPVHFPFNRRGELIGNEEEEEEDDL